MYIEIKNYKQHLLIADLLLITLQQSANNAIGESKRGVYRKNVSRLRSDFSDKSISF